MGQYFSFWFPNFPHWITVLSIVFMLTLFNLLGEIIWGNRVLFAIIKIITIVAIILIGLVIILFGIHTYYGQASF